MSGISDFKTELHFDMMCYTGELRATARTEYCTLKYNIFNHAQKNPKKQRFYSFQMESTILHIWNNITGHAN